MARKRMVTRTIVGTEATVLVVNLAEQETRQDTYYVSGTFKDDAKLLKAVKAIVDDDEEKVVAVISSEPVETLFGMDEQDFIQNAKKLDPETRKAISED